MRRACSWSGVGSALAELYVDNNVTGTQLLFGVGDNFYKQSGSQKYAREQLGLTAERFAERIISTILEKKKKTLGGNINPNRKASELDEIDIPRLCSGQVLSK